MPKSRHFIAAGLTGLVLALGAAACDNDEESRPAGTDSVVNTDTPQASPGDTAPPGSDPEVRTTRTDGE